MSSCLLFIPAIETRYLRSPTLDSTWQSEWSPWPVVDEAALKQDALAAHATAMPHGDYQRAVDGLNRYRGLYLGRNRLAEAFWVEPAKGQGLFKPVQAMALQMLTLVLKRR